MNEKKQTSNFVGIQLPILTKFGIIFDLFKEVKKSQDGQNYVQYSVMIKIIPGKNVGEYDNSKALTMKTRLEDVFGLSGALLAASYGQQVSYSIITDSSKNVYSDTSAQKMIYVKSDKGKIMLGASCKFSDGTKITDGVSLDRFKAYGIAKSIDEFCKACFNYIFTNNSK